MPTLLGIMRPRRADASPSRPPTYPGRFGRSFNPGQFQCTSAPPLKYYTALHALRAPQEGADPRRDPCSVLER